MTIAATVGAALADVAGVCVVVATADDVLADLLATLRAGEGEMLLLLIDPTVEPLDRTLLSAAVGPLAIERAPANRLGAILIEPGAAPDDVKAAALFLARARSTTGQVLTVARED